MVGDSADGRGQGMLIPRINNCGQCFPTQVSLPPRRAVHSALPTHTAHLREEGPHLALLHVQPTQVVAVQTKHLLHQHSSGGSNKRRGGAWCQPRC